MTGIRSFSPIPTRSASDAAVILYTMFLLWICRVWDIAMSSYEDNRRTICVRALSPQIEAVDFRQLCIENQARKQIDLRIGDIVRDGAERLGSSSKGLQQLAERLAHSFFRHHSPRRRLPRMGSWRLARR